MKAYPIFLLTLLLWGTLATSCENEIPFDLNDNPPKLVMNALINADSTRNVLFLNLTDRKQSVPVADATVEVRVDGQLTQTVHAAPTSEIDNRPNRYPIAGRFQPGQQVRIDAVTPDGKYHAWAEVAVPQRPQKIEKVDTARVVLSGGYGGYSNRYMQYKIAIDDRPNERNYYRLVMEAHLRYTTLPDEWDTEERSYRTISYNIISREDIVLTDGEPYTGEDESNGLFDKARNIYNVFDDTRFRDTRYVMTVYADYLPSLMGEVKDVQAHTVIRLQSLTETEFHYLKALNIVDSDAYDETIMEPVKYPGNVYGGTGMVGIHTETSYVQNITEPQVK